jgi:hypothetical protein
MVNLLTFDLTGDRPFACDWPQCGMWFTQSSNLNKHYLTHTNERPFKCLWPNCDKRFKQSSNLNKHRLVHTGLSFSNILFIFILFLVNFVFNNFLLFTFFYLNIKYLSNKKSFLIQIVGKPFSLLFVIRL